MGQRLFVGQHVGIDLIGELLHEAGGGRLPEQLFVVGVATGEWCEEEVHGLLRLDAHLFVVLPELRVGGNQGTECQVMGEIADELVLLLPVPVDYLTPAPDDVTIRPAVDEAVLNQGVRKLSCGMEEKRFLLFHPVGNGCREQTRGIDPVAAVTLQQVDAQDVGEVGVGDDAVPPFLHNIVGQLHIVGKIVGGDDVALLVFAEVPTHRCQAVPDQLGGVVLALEPALPDGLTGGRRRVAGGALGRERTYVVARYVLDTTLRVQGVETLADTPAHTGGGHQTCHNVGTELTGRNVDFFVGVHLGW